MKKYTYYIICLVLIAAVTISCFENKISKESVITEEVKNSSDWDQWLEKNFVEPYNIEIKYRMEDIETTMDYNLIPAEKEKCEQTAKLLLFLCLEAYDEVTGSKKFIQAYFPKILNLIGSGAYNNNGTYLLWTAEGGRKINLFDINSLRVDDINYMNTKYFNTIHHEFSHIFHQTIPYSPDFNAIAPEKYMGDSWNSKYGSLEEAYQDGFISPYASKNADEDFAEIVANFITNNSDFWDNVLALAKEDGANILKAKFEIIKDYLQNTWNVDIIKLRDIVQRRQGEIEIREILK